MTITYLTLSLFTDEKIKHDQITNAKMTTTVVTTEKSELRRRSDGRKRTKDQHGREYRQFGTTATFDPSSGT